MYGQTSTAAATAMLPVTGLALDVAWLALAGVTLLVVGASLRRLLSSWS